MLNRRELLYAGGAAAVSLAANPWLAARPAKKRILVYTRSQGFQHSVVEEKGGKPCLVDTVMKELGAKHDFDIECTKDGRVFSPESIAKFDAFFFYTTGVLTDEKSKDGSPPMPKEGKKALLDAIAGGKGFLGSHCASDTFHSKGTARISQEQKDIDPFLQMVGGEFISHGAQQNSKMRVYSPKFPGVKDVAEFELHEEWYSLKNFQKDLHVILAQDNKGMKGVDYERPRFPATWARMHGKGRVFYTSMGHKEEVWQKTPLFTDLLVGAMNWVTGRVDADVTPNIAKATPDAGVMPPAPPAKPAAPKK